MDGEILRFLVGPTASGKTRVALTVAGRLGVEILSMDSMSIYRGMDLGTAKPTAAQRRQVKHHLLDLVDPDGTFSVAEYVRAAREVLDELAARSRRGLFVGGTALYLKAMIAGIFAGPGEVSEVRRELVERGKHEGSQALHAELVGVDPEAARRIHPNDLRRVVRALEVLRTTGKPISQWQSQWQDGAGGRRHVIVGLAWEREELCRCIDRRVREMFAAGLVEEVRGLVARYGKLSSTASQAVGYAEVLEHLSGKTTLDQTIARVEMHTRQFAKRQMTWFRQFKEIRWVRMSDQMQETEAAQEVLWAFERGDE